MLLTSQMSSIKRNKKLELNLNVEFVRAVLSKTLDNNKRFIKKRTWHRCFPVNFVKFLRKLFSTEYIPRLLLEVVDKTEIFKNTFFTEHLHWLLLKE